MKPLRMGIVGLGVISPFYVAAIDQSPCAELSAVCDLDEAALRPYRSPTACYTGHAAMFAGAALDAVVVNVPNDVHVEVCRDAIAAGLPVCVEKPLATSIDAGEALVSLARDRGVPLFTAFHRRHNDQVAALRRRLPPGTPITEMTVRYLERIEDHAGRDTWYLDPQRCGGGCVADNGPNAFDLARLLLGGVAVEEAIISRDTRGVDRRALVTLRTASAATARVELDWSYAWGECKDIEVKLADGRVDRADMLAGRPGFKASLWHEYVGVLAEFIRVVGSGHDSSADGLAALQLVDAAYRAERPPGRVAPAAVERAR